MTKHDWKPGDVAMVTLKTRNGQKRLAIRTKPYLSDYVWLLFGDATPGIADGAVSDARPLALIDPEDLAQVSRLATLYNAATVDNRIGMVPLEKALREFANPTPPKPDEPTGLYARVEDAEGRIWVRTAQQASVWRRESRNTEGRRYLIPQDGCEHYADIAVVRVLSEGVTA